MKIRKRTDMFDEQNFNAKLCEKHDFGVCIYRKNKLFSILNCPNIEFLGSACVEYVCELFASEIKNFEIENKKNILYVGLGNTSITADALGEKTIKKLFISRGLDFDRKTSAFCPSVYAKTGIETPYVIKAITKELKPDLIIFFDTLATHSLSRLGTSFQIQSEGISVGSGVGNFNKTMDKEFLKTDVLVVGVPLMIYADKILKNKESDLVLTPKNIDKTVELCAEVISNSFNSAMFPELKRNEIKNIMGVY